MFELRLFQRQFLKAALSPKVDTAALSLPRGNGKSSLAGHLAARLLTPGDDLFRAGTESIVIARPTYYPTPNAGLSPRAASDTGLDTMPLSGLARFSGPGWETAGMVTTPTTSTAKPPTCAS